MKCFSLLFGALVAFQMVQAAPQPLDLLYMYTDITEVLMRGGGCYWREMEDTQRTIESAYVYTKQVCSPSDMKTCYKGVTDMLNAHVAKVRKSMEGSLCLDFLFKPILDRLADGLKGTERSLFIAVRTFASQPIWQDPLDLVRAYKDIDNGLDGKEIGCLRASMDKARDELETVHKEVQKCDDNSQTSASCYKDNLNRLVTYFNKIDADQKNSKCFDKVFSPIVARILYGLSTGNDTLNVIKSMANSEIGITSFKYSDYYYRVGVALRSAGKFDCHRSNIISAQKKLESAHDDAIDCFDPTGDQTQVQKCATGIIDRLRAYWDEEDKDLKARNCANKEYDTIRDYVQGGYKLRLVTLIKNLQEYAKYQIVDAVFTPVAYYEKISDGISKGIYGCAKWTAQKTLNLLQDAQDNAQKCSANAKITDPNACYKGVLDQIRAFVDNYDMELGTCDNEYYLRFRDDLTKVLKLRQKELIEGIKKLGDTDLKANVGFTSPVAPITNANALPQQQTQSSNLDAVSKVDQCFADETARLAQAQQLFRPALLRCADTAKTSKPEDCYKYVFYKIVATFVAPEHLQCFLALTSPVQTP